MFIINGDLSIYLTRGDAAVIDFTAKVSEDENEENYIFQPNDEVHFRIMQKNRCDVIVLDKAVTVESSTETITFELTREDTKIGDIINKPKDYWYEVEANPDTDPKTLLGYDTLGPKLFRLYPEGSDA